MKRFGLTLAVVLSMAGMASAGIEVIAPSFALSNSDTHGGFSVAATFAGSYDVAGYDVMLTMSGRNGATGLSFASPGGASEAATAYIFSLGHDGFGLQTDTASVLFGQDNASAGTEMLTNTTRNLMDVNLVVSPGTLGVFDVLVSRADGFNDGHVSFSDQAAINGVITVTPEPATMTLVIAGVLAALGRRRWGAVRPCRLRS
jgi:hypothetical protein